MKLRGRNAHPNRLRVSTDGLDRLTGVSMLSDGHTQTRETIPGLMDMQYNYTAGANNGQISGTVDYINGETVSYTYDSLKRLATAQTGPSGPQWGEAYSYDGFGNLTGKTVTKGSAPSFSATYNPATNQPCNGNYDANGNAPIGTWDIENHLVRAKWGEMGQPELRDFRGK